ncbi:MAG: PAS domain S-box protein [Desulfobacteraceae bacterium]|nr:PAS domain S-box protein [Desulfobacteraceae bacterium]
MENKPTYEALEKKVSELEEDLAVISSRTEALRNTNTVLESQVERLTLDLENSQRCFREDMEDLDEIKKSLEASEEKYRLHFANVSEVIFYIDSSFRIQNISPSVFSEWGYPSEELIGKQIAELNILTPNSLENVSSHAMLLFSGENISPAVHEFITREGGRKLAEVRYSPVVQNDNVVGIVCVTRNITERRTIEEERMEKQKLKGVIEMARTVSYELNQPIQAIFSHAELMMMDLDEKNPVYDKLKMIQDQVYTLAKTIKQLGRTTQYKLKENTNGETIIDLEKSARTENATP